MRHLTVKHLVSNINQEWENISFKIDVLGSLVLTEEVMQHTDKHGNKNFEILFFFFFKWTLRSRLKRKKDHGLLRQRHIYQSSGPACLKHILHHQIQNDHMFFG